MKVPTQLQVSAGGVAFRHVGEQIEIAVISVGEEERWQLPKGIVGRGESPEAAALREVREETGIETEMVGEIDTVEYWFYSKGGEKRIRFHKFVHFYLLRGVSGNIEDHDDEVNEARWVEIEQAREMLAFDNEKRVVDRAQEMIVGLPLVDPPI